jgi:hypothetical protein
VVAALGDLGVQHGGVVAALVPPAVQVGLVAVQDGGPGDGPGHRVIGGDSVGEAAGCLAGHAEFAGDPAQSHAPGMQGLDGGVLVFHPRGQPGIGRRIASLINTGRPPTGTSCTCRT